MKIEAVLLDLDGLILTGRHRYFSERLAEEHHVPLEEIMPFFQTEYKECTVGKLDLKVVLPPWLKRWRWQGTVDDFLAYWFEGENQVDKQVIAAVDSWRSGGTKCAIATDNEKYRLGYILEELGVGEHFDQVFASCRVGHKKPSKEFFDNIFASASGFDKRTTIFWDDDPKNVQGGTEYGLPSYLYTNFAEFAQVMSSDYNLTLDSSH